MSIKLKILHKCRVYLIDCYPWEMVEDIKARLKTGSKDLSKNPQNTMKLIFQAEVILDSHSLYHYGIQDGSTLVMINQLEEDTLRTDITEAVKRARHKLRNDGDIGSYANM